MCVVEEIEEIVQVMDLKSIDNSKQEFLVVEKDLSFINFDQIPGNLPSPEIAVRGDRLRYIFNTTLDIKEKLMLMIL